ncbi:hypothetical protein [Sphingopyxis sp. Geo48]|uniref:hypothetical protein n=1 Tax=Sphingopyxis sp. Geo48 TaxID=545241 RepID=UPI0024B74E77|nr:hypothetical protein [Sphingopyxis sp. Geo48]
MSESKRGRPALPVEQKRQQIGVRTSPALKGNLEQAAKANGRSVAQEAEFRLLQSFDDERRAGGEHTDRLLRQVAAEIEEIEAVTKKRWSKDLTTWAAVARMFERGPVRRARPDRTSDDEIIMEAFGRLHQAEQEKRELCAVLGAHHIYALADLPEDQAPLRRAAGGIFGSTINALAVGTVPPGPPDRSRERKALAAMVDDKDTAAELSKVIDRIEELDEIHRKAKAEWEAAREPYDRAEAAGRELYRQMWQRRAQELFQQGDYSLMGEAF